MARQADLRWAGCHGVAHKTAMKLNVLKSKIHRATVTQADADYEGSVSIDADLMEAANILPYEAVHLWNVTQGTRLVTYALEAPAGSGTLCVNGAAARQNAPGDLVILATFAEMSPDEVRVHRPLVVRVDRRNHRLPDDRPERAFTGLGSAELV
jgi:aspartate 1-decarboxylase